MVSSSASSGKEGLVYSTTNGIYLYRKGDDDILIKPVGGADCLCYHKGQGCLDGALFDTGWLDFSRIRENKIKLMGGFPTPGVYNTLLDELVSGKNGIQVLCSSGGRLLDSGITRAGGYHTHFRDTFTGKSLEGEEGFKGEHVTAMCSHKEDLFYGTFDGEIKKGDKVIARRNGIIQGLASNILLHDLTVVGGKGGGYDVEIRKTSTGKIVARRNTTGPRTPTLLSLNNILLDLNFDGKEWALHETYSRREIPMVRRSPISGKKEIKHVGDVCAVPPEFVERILRRTEW